MIDATQVRLCIVLLCVASIVSTPSPAGDDLGHLGAFAKWARIDVVLEGPQSSSGGNPNPFAVELTARFTGPSGQVYVVPGFYDGDGEGGSSGIVWKARFSADEVGHWTFSTSSDNDLLDGYTGSFDATAPAADAPEFYRWGRLEYGGTAQNDLRYMKFRDGPFWLKAGMDDPENFLGSASNYNTVQERKAAVDYLAGHGINSLYMMTHNVDGDNNDVWPWLGSSVGEARSNGADNARFDIAKLAEWLDLFEHMQAQGVATYLVLEDDAAWTGYDHERYYRELVARFGHLPALMFNFCEEYNESYSLSQALSFMQLLREVDPYDHPRAIHNVNAPTNSYIDASQLDFTSIQTHDDALGHNERTLDWIAAARSRGKRIPMVGFDEPRPLMDRRGWWSAYMGGGVWEVHADQPYDRPMSAWATALKQLGGARAFMESVPFQEMEPANHLVESGTAFCLARPGEAYALYLPSGGSVTLQLPAGVEYDFAWWRASNDRGDAFQNAGTVAGGNRTFSAPSSGDWALRIIKAGGDANGAPIAEDSSLNVEPGSSVTFTLAYTDPDGPGPYTYSLVEAPVQGTLAGSGGSRTYTAFANAEGLDSLRWQVHDGIDDSNIATVSIDFVTNNFAPSVTDQSLTTTAGVPLDIALSYDDSDGPGPYVFTIAEAPTHGSVAQDNPGSNDFVYTAGPGFVGTDTFRWGVHDGVDSSAAATVTIVVEPPSGLPAPENLHRVDMLSEQ